MPARSPLAVTLTMAALLSATSCGGSNPGTASVAPTTSSASQANQAPRVSEPIANTSGVEASPCSAVPIDVVESAGGKVKNTEVDTTAFGKNCAWIFDGGTGNVNGGLVTANKDGLNSLYIKKDQGALTTFKPQPPIEGYPAVIYANGGEGRGACALAAGVRDDLTYTVIVELRTGNPALSDPCSMATKLATAAITHLKGN